MKEQGNFDGRNISSSVLNGEKKSFLPETNKSDEAKKIATRTFANLAPVGDELRFDGNVEINLGQLPKEPLRKILIENDKFDGEQKPFRPDSPVKKFFRKFAEVGSATAVLATVGSAIPAIAEEVPADVALGINTDEVRKAINSVATAEASPAPTAEVTVLDEKHDKDRYLKSIQEIKDYGCSDDATAEAYGRFLYARDNDMSNSKSLQKSVSRESILEGSINGEKSDEYDVYVDEDTGTRIFFAYKDSNHDSTIIDGFAKLVDKLKEFGYLNFPESLNKNGLNVVFCDWDSSTSGTGASFNDTGALILNLSCESVKESGINLELELFYSFSTESLGIAQSNMLEGVGGLEDAYDVVEINKSMLAACDLAYRYIQQGNVWYFAMVSSDFITTTDYFIQTSDKITSLSDPYLVRQLYLLVNGGSDSCGLVKSMNLESWSEIFNTLAVEVLGWNGVDITDEVKFGELISELHDKIPGFLG